MVLHAKMLGEFQMTVDGVTIQLATAEARELAAFLVWHHDEWVDRKRLCRILAPSDDEARAWADVDDVIRGLGKSLDGRARGVRVETSRLSTRLDCWGQQVRIDVRDLEDRLAATPRAIHSKGCALLDVVLLYDGVFLQGMENEWAEAVRQQLEGLRRATFTSWMLQMLDAGHYDLVLAHGAEFLRRDPSNEEVHRGLMWANHLKRDYAAAFRQFEWCCIALREGLGAEPCSLTVRMYDRIRAAAVLDSARDD